MPNAQQLALIAALVAALEEMLASHSMANIGLQASQRRLKAKEQARVALDKARLGATLFAQRKLAIETA